MGCEPGDTNAEPGKTDELSGLGVAPPEADEDDDGGG
jgi:hypothetical protein